MPFAVSWLASDSKTARHMAHCAVISAWLNKNASRTMITILFESKIFNQFVFNVCNKEKSSDKPPRP